MPPKRKSRAAQLHPQPLVESELDDTEAPTEAPTFLAPPPRSNTELNLTVLRRYIPAITSIVSIAPFAVLYTFSPDSQQWEKCGVEGTLFVCKLEGGKYSVFMLNRKSLENFEAELKSADDVEVTEEYVILQATGEGGTPVIYGLWIFEDGDGHPTRREEVAGSIVSCAMQAQIAREAGKGENDVFVEADRHANGHAAATDYGIDGTTQMQEQMEEEEALSEQVGSQQTGQKLDLLQLFGSKPAESYSTPAPAPAPQAEPAQPTRFTATADTDFFRTSQSPAFALQQQPAPAQPPRQQNALLDLFKS